MKKRIITAVVIIVSVFLLLGVFYWSGYLVFQGTLPTFTFNPTQPQSDTSTENQGTPMIVIENVKGRFRKISADIRNIGDQDAMDVNWSISVEGGILKRINRLSTGSLSSLSTQSGTTIISNRVPLGFGRLEITITVEASRSETVTTTARGFLLFFFLIGVRT